MELIKIGDVAVSEQKVVESTTIASSESKEKSEKQATSTKKSKPKKQSRGTVRAKMVKEDEEEIVSLYWFSCKNNGEFWVEKFNIN